MRNVSGIKKTCIALLLLGIFVFAPHNLLAQEQVKSAGKTITRLAVVPFQKIAPQDASSTIRCPICGTVNASGPIAKGAEIIIEGLFTDRLKDMKNVEIIPSEKVAEIYQRISANSMKQPLMQIMQNVGREIRADVIAVGYVYRFRERVGYDYSAELPASVVFEIHMISVKDGSTLWRGIFDKTQKSLMEDVFQLPSFFKGGAKWVTARELAKLGVDEAFSTFSGFDQ